MRKVFIPAIFICLLLLPGRAMCGLIFGGKIGYGYANLRSSWPKTLHHLVEGGGWAEYNFEKYFGLRGELKIGLTFGSAKGDPWGSGIQDDLFVNVMMFNLLAKPYYRQKLGNYTVGIGAAVGVLGWAEDRTDSYAVESHTYSATAFPVVPFAFVDFTTKKFGTFGVELGYRIGKAKSIDYQGPTDSDYTSLGGKFDLGGPSIAFTTKMDFFN